MNGTAPALVTCVNKHGLTKAINKEKTMDKIINTCFALLILGVLIVGMTAIQNVNDGRVLAAVKKFQPSVAPSSAQQLPLKRGK